jgi:hypothetical protein
MIAHSPALIPALARIRLDAALRNMLTEGTPDRRTEARIPFCGPVSVTFPDSDVRVSAFARDVSRGGIGLVHLAPLEPGEVIVSLRMPSDRAFAFRTEITWFRSYAEGWFASGGRFLDVAG